MRKAPIVIVFVALSAVAAVAQVPMSIAVGNVRIDVPPGWLVENTQASVLFMMYAPAEANDDFNENANVSVEQLPGPYTIEEYRTAGLEVIGRIFSAVELLEQHDNWHIYSAVTNGVEIRQMQYFYIEDMVAYTLTFTASPRSFKRFRGQFEQIESTLVIE